MGLFVVCPDAAPASRGYETGTFSDTRTLAGTRDLFEGVVETGDRGSAVRKRLQTAVDAGSAGAVLTTSFAREGAYGFDWCDTTSANPDAPRIAARARASNPCHVSPRDGISAVGAQRRRVPGRDGPARRGRRALRIHARRATSRLGALAETQGRVGCQRLPIGENPADRRSPGQRCRSLRSGSSAS
jgi:hypothetical protein